MEKKVLPNQQVKVLTEALQKATEANQAQAKELAFLRPLVGKQTMTASPKMPELLPCPFCGGKGVEMHFGAIFYGVECENEGSCGLRLNSMVISREEANAIWNRRTPPPAPSTPESVGDAGNLTEYAFQKWWDENVRDNEKISFVYRIAFNAWMEAKKSL